MTIDKIDSSLHHSRDIQPQRIQAPERVSLTNLNEQAKAETASKGYKEPTKDTVEQAVDNLNKFIEPVRRNLKFEMHEKLEKYYVKVVDSKTDEVIKEIPPKEMLDMYAEMVEFMGLLVDKKI